jgi:predicted phosphodiesterase
MIILKESRYMRYAVLSDIHSNLPALQVVLQKANEIGFDEMICLGDLVGYGPNPNECIEAVYSLPHNTIAGNHDWGAIGKADLIIFNRDARQALNWTQGELTHQHRQLLQSLPVTRPLPENILLSHGSPRKPVWEYLVDTNAANANFKEYDFEIALVGHTHLPLVFELNSADKVKHIMPVAGEPYDLTSKRAILNPGSVGQPRDMNPDASFALLDTDQKQWTFFRLPYPIEVTQERMRKLQLPTRLIARLEVGR